MYSFNRYQHKSFVVSILIQYTVFYVQFFSQIGFGGKEFTVNSLHDALHVWVIQRTPKLILYSIIDENSHFILWMNGCKFLRKLTFNMTYHKSFGLESISFNELCRHIVLILNNTIILFYWWLYHIICVMFGLVIM